MLAKMLLGAFIFLFAMGSAVLADDGGDVSAHFNSTAREVKSENDPVQKRAILSKSLQTMTSALDKIESSGLISSEDRIGASRLKANLKEKQDELNGANSFERVPDSQLNNYSDYIVQDMQQANQYITISVVTLLLIIILAVLIL
jgi:hypothetical protein